jgi:superfamily I DNA/RNA helicase
MTILVRTAYAARAVESGPDRTSDSLRVYGRSSLLKAAHVRDLLALLRVVINQARRSDWMRYLTLFKGIGDQHRQSAGFKRIAACSDLAQVTTFLYRAKPEPQASCHARDARAVG